MGNYFITIDTGTTNTRVSLIDHNNELVSMESAEVGVKNAAINGNNQIIKETIKNCLEVLLSKNHLTYYDICCIMASGMITSNVGLVEIPHIQAPVSINKLISNIKTVSLPEVCPIPFHFIPGIKNNSEPVSYQNFESMDIMRGEETEAFAVIHSAPGNEPLILVLPGSHMKFIYVSKEQEILHCITTISGELISCITKNTIIADAVKHSFVNPSEYDRDMVILGYRTSQKNGFSRACFCCRILNQFVQNDPQKLANYILGVSLQCDIMAIKNFNHSAAKVIVAGKEPLQSAIYDLLKFDGSFPNMEAYIPCHHLSLSALGASLIAEQAGFLPW